MAQKKIKGLTCERGAKRFTVVVVGKNPHDSHAGRSFQEAMDLAMPDRGSRVDVYVTCAKDGGEARLPANYAIKGKLTRSFRFKRRG